MADLLELQELIVSVRSDRGFTTDPVRILTLLVEEVGEIASELKKTWSANYPDMDVDDLADEIADAFVLLSALASSQDIDLEHAVRRKFVERDAKRSWATGSPPDDIPGATADNS